uniref:Cytosolic phospholipase A2 zeta n=1 Tax=Oncorhynchus kisutch TaxID=8019 RepID=A0A8C7K054_ONCKI
MSSLYSHPDWSLNKRCDEVIQKLKGPTVDLSKIVEWLKSRKGQNRNFNLTDFWGAFTASYFMKEMNTRCLSEEAHRNSTNPYPIYSAIELEHNQMGCTKAVWFEMTPHESGFSGLGAFVPTSCLGSQFDGGTLREKRKEMDMVLLQGICGSAIADGQRNNAEVVQLIWDLLGVSFSAGIETNGQDSMMLMSGIGREEEEVCNCAPFRVVRCVSELMKYGEDPDPLKTSEVITTLGQLLKGHVSSKGEMLWNMDPESWKRTSLVERKKFIETVSLELILSSDSWAKDWKDQRCTCNDGSKYMKTTRQTVNLSITNFWIFDELWIVRNIFPLVHKWEWGTVYNFFLNITDASVPESMRLKDKIHLVDAGLKINSPYPPVLRTSRKVDLIISLDFSAGDPFEANTHTHGLFLFHSLSIQYD